MTPYPMRVTRSEFSFLRAKAKAKKERRAEKRVENAALAPRQASAVALGRVKRSNRRPNARKSAFKRLKSLCSEFVKLRAKHRTGGFCEVAMKCQGRGPIEVAYHVTPQKLGNALKFDARNLLGACSLCNGSEFFARMRGATLYRERHAAILGAELFAELERTAGRKQISTVEANEMADAYKAAIEAGEFRR